MKNNKIVQITVDKKAVRNKSFIYRVPRGMNLGVGSLVLVPFRDKRIVGVVNLISKQNKNSSRFKIKPIESIIYPQPLLSRKQLRLARFISQKYFAPLASVVFVMLPHYLRTIKKAQTIKGLVKKSAHASPERTTRNHPKPNHYLLFDPTNKHTFPIYKKAILKSLSNDRGVIFLVPDLDLPIVKKIKALSQKSIILSSENKTEKEVFIDWLGVKEGKYNLIIGSHSAIFAPLNNVGLIIVHQENDIYYKNDQLPKYHLREVAIKLSKLNKSSIILQSATPSLESLMLLNKKLFILIPYRNLNIKIGLQDKKNPIKVIDLKQEQGLISLAAEKIIEQNLNFSRKTLLFLNRKGFSRLFICKDCGYSRHLSSKESPPALCPQCKKPSPKEHSCGTKRLEYDLKKRFPRANILRLDNENREIVNLKLKIKNYDIIIATSFIFKYDVFFDSVIIVLAEIGTYLPDFRSAELLFSTLTRVLRLGKKKIIQTYYPEHQVIKAIILDSYSFFAQEEMQSRKSNFYPPFSTLIRLTYEDPNKTHAKKEADTLARNLRKINADFNSQNQVLGPSAVFIQPKNKIKIEILIKGKNPYPLLSIVPDKWKVDVDPLELLK